MEKRLNASGEKNEKCQGEGVRGGYSTPCGQDTIQYGSKPLFWKLIIFQTTVEKKTEIKTNIGD